MPVFVNILIFNFILRSLFKDVLSKEVLFEYYVLLLLCFNI